MRAQSRFPRSSTGLFLALIGLMTGLIAPGYCQDRLSSAPDKTALTTPPSWTATGNLNTPRIDHTATLLNNGKVLVVGGWSDNYPYPPLDSAELYDTTTGTWSATSSLNSAPGYHTATLLPNGKVLVVGLDIWQQAQVGGRIFAELYDFTTGTWSATGALTGGQIVGGASATLLPNGKVLVVEEVLGEDGLLSWAELYDPAAGTWRPAGSPSSLHTDHTATLLQNGNVLVVGGKHDPYATNFNTLPSKADLYDPVSDSWKEVGPAIFSGEHTATLLLNGKVLVAGGALGGQPPFGAVAILYDPATETFVGAGNIRCCGHTATLLPNGKVLLAAGGAGGDGLSNLAELYDPDTGMWTSTSTLNAARSHHTATLLPSGSVLVAGGVGAEEWLTSAELYGDVALPHSPIGPGHTGAWFDPAQSGHGLFIEVLPNNRLLAGWLAFNPAGTGQAWIIGVGTYRGNTATIINVEQPTGGRWIPNFDPNQIVSNLWGTLTFTFTDCNHGRVDFNSVTGYGTGSMNLTRLTQPEGLTCP